MNDLTIAKDPIVLMPVFEDRRSAVKLVQDLASKLAGRCYIIVVEDGSVADPMRIADITAAGVPGEVLYLARNMGHQRAIATGLTYIATTFQPAAVVVMDSDGEDRAEAVPALLGALQAGSVDIAVAQRARRSEPLSFQIFYAFYRFIFQMFTGRSIRFGNFAALSARGVRRLASMQEVWLHFASALIVSRLGIKFVPTDRGKRYFGRSSMNFVSLALHGMRSMMVFAEDVLVRIGLFCSLVAACSILSLATTTTLKFLGFATPGWFSTLSGILIVILFQAGILTFVTLMVAGTMRSAPPVSREQLALFIERVDKGVPVAAPVRAAQLS